MHYFYLARCADGSLYAGTCINPIAREALHNAGKGAKYTRSRLPIEFVHIEKFKTLSEARKREAEVKRWVKTKKESLIRTRSLTPRRKAGRHS